MIRPKPILTVLLAIAGLFMTAQSVDAQQLRLEARLAGATRASGQAKFEQRGARMKFNVELEDAAQNANFGVVVRRGSTVVYRGSIRTDAFGRGEIDIDNTEGDVVPRMQSGDAVVVNSGTSRLLSGTLQPR